MPRAKHPKPYQITVGLARQGWRQQEDRTTKGREVVARLYDRRSGNFQPVGWLVKISYKAFSDQPGKVGYYYGSDVVPLLDEFIPNYVQSTL